jgi:hypothetical protein
MDDSDWVFEDASNSLQSAYKALGKFDKLSRAINGPLQRIENSKASKGNRRGPLRKDLLLLLTRAGEVFFSLGRY